MASFTFWVAEVSFEQLFFHLKDMLADFGLLFWFAEDGLLEDPLLLREEAAAGYI